MAEPNLWWLLTGAAVAIELLTGTFYLLMLAAGLAAAALAAHAGTSPAVQVVTAAVVGGGAVLAWHFKRDRGRTEPPAQANANVNLDIGETVYVALWEPDGTAHVNYRGAQWTAIHRPDVDPEPGVHRVAELVGNRLVLERI